MLRTQIDQNSQMQAVAKADFQTKFTIFLLYGFYFLDKIFFFLSFPIVTFLLFDRRVFFDRVYAALTKPGYLGGVAWAMLLSTLFGIGEVIYGVLVGNSVVTALQILVFNLSPWLLFFGIVAGMQRPIAVRNYIRFLAYYHAIMTPAYYLLLRHVNFTVGGQEIGFQPSTGSVVLIGLLCFEKKLSQFWFPILICVFDTIGAQMRADWLGFILCVGIWGAVTGQLKRVVSMAAMIVTLLAIGFVADVRLPAIPGRGGEFSARDTVARAMSGVDPELAQEYSKNAGTYAGTIQWRENWWKAIREEVFLKTHTAIFGLGYGYVIGDLVPYMRHSDTRSPHSVLYFTLAYSGLMGILLFSLLQLRILGVLWITFKQSGQIFGFLFAIFAIANSLLGNLLEAPNRAMPIYIIYGMCMAPLFQAIKGRMVNDDTRSDRAITRPTTTYQPIQTWLPQPLAATYSSLPRRK